ncbi:PspC domain-containing protein [Jejuia pallidilutea]|uniref:Glutamate synthase [NADPH] large chain n=2 Tax=Jejuia pallidilutea TaxID=504487 RepID=A0A090VTH6_9FLAO|nr:PspC domain-containing protein [Jejuia pallidilutea]GAL68030.1 glutamate synthase [NADPH] large chain [Jejuia pallidilutea]GAL90229.1 glutamate synthase [NADPH] large chain [Jejuia pallidilutea]
MNKTVNINLAGIFFHIDEDAYLKLQRYLEAIKRSFTDSQGQSEIIADIEARIAELFNERVQNDKQVIRITEVDAIIAIMGQPEDYLVDDEIFEDEPKQSYTGKSSPNKKLYRDTDNSYIGGVSSGLAHYFGIDTIWIRLAWILLFFGAGTGVLLYILLWILVPEAKTTAEKIMMTGEPVNISNIEKKIKDGFDTVTETVGDVAKNVSDSVSKAAKNVDVKKSANSIKSSSRSFFETLGDIILFFFKIFAKFIGVLLIFIGAVTLISLIVSLFTVGISDAINVPGFDFVDAANAANTPVWLVSVLVLFAVGIPFFFLFYLGLKILVNNLKSIGNIAKFSLLGLWIIAIIGIAVVFAKQASEHAFDANVTKKEPLNITAKDTLRVKMVGNDNYYKSNSGHLYRDTHGFKLVYNENDEKMIYSSDIRLIVRSTKDSLASLSIEKTSEGSSYQIAKQRAEQINYNYALVGKELLLDAYLTTDFKHKFRDQEVHLILYLPEGSTLYADDNTYSFHRNTSNYNDILQNGQEEHYLKILHNATKCMDCDDDTFDVNVDTEGIKINEDGIEIRDNNDHVKINSNGINVEADDVKVNINKNGIDIKSDN